MNTSAYPHLQKTDRAPLAVTDLARMKADGEKIAALTAYDASFGALAERAGADLVLVGDSLGMVVQGQSTTVPVTVDDIVYHTRCVAAGLSKPLLVADLPFLSFATRAAAVTSCRRLLGEGGAQMVKFEGGAFLAETIAHLSDHGVSICAHLGLRPQLVNKIGGFKVQGRGDAAAKTMKEDARVLEGAGADMLLLECVPAALAAEIAAQADVPVIGIGAGPEVDGQILVVYDAVGLSPGKKPRFVEDFMAGADSLDAATANYVAAVKDQSFPSAAHSFED